MYAKVHFFTRGVTFYYLHLAFIFFFLYLALIMITIKSTGAVLKLV